MNRRVSNLEQRRIVARTPKRPFPSAAMDQPEPLTSAQAAEHAVALDNAQANSLVNPWLFVPALYVMQAIPVTLVQEVSSIAFKGMGVDNEMITRVVSLLSLPWSIKLLWGPLVDLNGTKRGWMVATQTLLILSLGIAALTFLGGKAAFYFTVSAFALTAFFSATCDIATDGYYLLALGKAEQAKFVGVQSACYRAGRLFCTGFLVYLSGSISERLTGRMDNGATIAWTSVMLLATAVYGIGRVIVGWKSPKPVADRVRVSSEGDRERNILRTVAIIAFGLTTYFVINSLTRFTANFLADSLGSVPLLGDLKKGWGLTHDQIVVEQIQLFFCSVGAVGTYFASRALVRGTEMGTAFSTFVRQKGFVAILLFMTFYRFGEVMVVRMAPLFLKDSVEKGGLAMSDKELGLANGFAGVLGIIAGGIVGGFFLSRIGLKRGFWPVAIAMHAPNLLYLWAAIVRPDHLWIYPIAFFDQFGYGFGYAAYAVYLMQVASRTPQYKTSHYAIATALGATFIAIAGASSGIIQANFGYVTFFFCVIFASLPGMLTLLIIPHDEPAGTPA